jgi:uncharacterized protein (DUF433 family)
MTGSEEGEAMNLPDFLTQWPLGEIRLTGHRIGLYHVIRRYQEGLSVERIHEWYPTLEPELIQKVLDFHQAHQAEVDAHVAQTRAELDRQEAAAGRVDHDELRRRAEKRKRTGTDS